MRDEAERQTYVRWIGSHLGIENPDIPRHLGVPTVDELRELKALGITIGNHGWSHASYLVMSAGEFDTEIQRGFQWLDEYGLLSDRVFAVPDGKALPPKPISPSSAGLYLLADDRLRPGRLGDRVVNRFSVDYLATSESLDEGLSAAALEEVG
jgi:peptidoglycan/xylan/chitin deacetylase (PgdA/CDA1 family)